MKKKQIAIIWVCCLIIIPIIYFMTIELKMLNTQIYVWRAIEKGETKTVPSQLTEEQKKASEWKYKNITKKQKLLNIVGLVLFELIGIAGLLVFLSGSKQQGGCPKVKEQFK